MYPLSPKISSLITWKHWPTQHWSDPIVTVVPCCIVMLFLAPCIWAITGVESTWGKICLSHRITIITLLVTFRPKYVSTIVYNIEEIYFPPVVYISHSYPQIEQYELLFKSSLQTVVLRETLPGRTLYIKFVVAVRPDWKSGCGGSP